MAGPRFTIVITTHSRRAELLRALESCVAQAYHDREILVYDDASSDGTSAAVRRLYPEVRLLTVPERRGLIVGRNAAAREASGRLIVSLDDDAYLTNPHTFDCIADQFDREPRTGALALPFLEPCESASRPAPHPIRPGTRLRSFVGCAHAVRRDLFLTLGGYRERLVHQGEERDFCIRLLDAGYDVVQADTPQVVHDRSPRRDLQRAGYYGYRNTLLFALINVPQPYTFLLMARNTLQLLVRRPRQHTRAAGYLGLLAGWCAAGSSSEKRTPVRRETYFRFRALPMHGATPCPAHELPRPLTRPLQFVDRDSIAELTAR